MESNVILCVDDDATILTALGGLLSSAMGAGHVIEFAESGEEALEFCQEVHRGAREVSVIITDFIMPGMRGDELLVRLHASHPNTVKIMLTGQSDVDGIKRAINEANLYRFLEKPFNNADIVLTVKSALQAFRQSRELEQRIAELERINKDQERKIAQRTAELLEKNKRLELLSISDSLTGLYNRLRLDQVLEDELNRCKRSGKPFCLVLLDVDHFKAVNDTYGHQVGDQVLVDIAGLLTRTKRVVDVVGRWGGEEFLVICPDAEIDGGFVIAEKLRLAIAEHAFPVVGHKTGSFGVAACNQHDTVGSVIGRADAALYRAKGNGRNRVDG